MDETVDLSRIRKLRDDSPTTVMGWVRLAWPEIKDALERHVALKTIHKRLNEAGLPISYPRLSLYVGRLRREEQVKPPPRMWRKLLRRLWSTGLSRTLHRLSTEIPSTIFGSGRQTGLVSTSLRGRLMKTS